MHSLGGSVSGAGGSQQFQGIASARSRIRTPGETEPAQVIGTLSVSLERQSEEQNCSMTCGLGLVTANCKMIISGKIRHK